MERRPRTGKYCQILAVLWIVGLSSCGAQKTPTGVQWTPKTAGGKAAPVAAPETPVLGHSGTILAIAFAPDGKSLLTSSTDGTAKLWEIPQYKPVADLKGHGGPVFAACFSPNGQFIATGGQDKTIRLWEQSSRKLIKTLGGHDGPIRQIEFSPQGKLFASGSTDGTVKLWDIKTYQVVRTLQAGDVRTLSFTPDGRTLVTAGSDANVRIWDAVSGDLQASLSGHSGAVNRAIFFPDGKTLATCGEDQSVCIWDVTNRKQLHKLNCSAELTSLAISADGKRLAAGTGFPNSQHPQPGVVTVWDTAGWNQVATLHGHLASVYGAAFSPCNQMLATGGGDRTIRMWDMTTLQQSAVLRGITIPGQTALMGHLAGVNAVSCSSDGKLIATACADGAVKLWDRATRDEVWCLAAHKGTANSVAFAPDCQTIASGGEDHELKLWRVASGELKGTLIGHTGSILSIAFASDGARIVSGSADGTVRLWDSSTKQTARSFESLGGPVSCVAYAPGRQSIAFAVGNEIQLCDLQSQSLLNRWRGHTRPVKQLQFSPDGSLLASAAEDGTAMLWTIATGESRKLAGHIGSVRCVAFTSDGLGLLTAGDDRTIRFWDTSTAQLQFHWLQRHDGPITGLAAINASLASVSADRELKFWDLEPPAESAKFQGHTGRIWCMAVAPDGRTLATGSIDHTLRLWDIASGRLVGTLRQNYSVHNLAFSQTEPTVAVVSYMPQMPAGELKLWDLRIGDELAVTLPTMPLVASAAFSPNGRLLATAHLDSAIRVWDYPSMKLQQELSTGNGLVQSIQFSPDGALLASGGTDRRVRIWHVENWDPHAVLTKHSKSVRAIAFSPDAKILASSSDDRTIRLWNPLDGAELAMLTGPRSGITALAFAPDGNRIAGSCEGTRPFLWDVATRKALGALEKPDTHDPICDGITFLPGSDRFVSGNQSRILIFNVAAGSSEIVARETTHGDEQFTLTGHTDVVREPLFAPNGLTLATRSEDRTVRLWDTTEFKSRGVVQDGNWPIACFAFSRDSVHLAIGAGPHVSLWNVATGERIARLGSYDQQQRVYSIAFSADGSLLATGSGYESNATNEPGHIKIWSVPEQRELSAFPPLPGNIDDLNFSMDSSMLASSRLTWRQAFTDGGHQNRFWQVSTKSEITGVQLADDSTVFLLSGQRFVESTGDAVIFRDLRSGRELQKITHAFRRQPLTVKSLDGGTIAVLCRPLESASMPKAAGSGGRPDVLVVDCQHMAERWLRAGGRQGISAMSISPDGKLVATVLNDNSVTVLDTSTGEVLKTLQGHNDKIHDVAISSDGNTVATVSADNTAKVWRIR